MTNHDRTSRRWLQEYFLFKAYSGQLCTFVRYGDSRGPSMSICSRRSSATCLHPTTGFAGFHLQRNSCNEVVAAGASIWHAYIAV